MLPRSTIMGRLIRDPEMRVTSGGLTITKIAVASSEKFTKKDGQEVEKTVFTDIDCFGKQAEAVAKFFVKGKPIIANVKMKTDSWETQNGEKRNKLGFDMESFAFVLTDNTRADTNSIGQTQREATEDPVQFSSRGELEDEEVDF